jgi:predicted branched-subunit amino acid permease
MNHIHLNRQVQTAGLFSFLIIFSGLIFGISLTAAGYTPLLSLVLTTLVISGAVLLPVCLLGML